MLGPARRGVGGSERLAPLWGPFLGHLEPRFSLLFSDFWLSGGFWTLLEPPTISKSLPGASRNLSGASRNRTGRPQNWSPAISGSPKPLKINEKPMFFAQNPSKTSCNLPRALWKRHRASWSHPKGPRRSLRRPGTRARGVRPASKLVPGDFWQPKTILNQ